MTLRIRLCVSINIYNCSWYRLSNFEKCNMLKQNLMLLIKIKYQSKILVQFPNGEKRKIICNHKTFNST